MIGRNDSQLCVRVWPIQHCTGANASSNKEGNNDGSTSQVSPTLDLVLHHRVIEMFLRARLWTPFSLALAAEARVAIRRALYQNMSSP